jgi:predicted nucleic-acid-binding protein
MRAVDTNLLVRYVTGDDPTQSAKARTVIGGGPVFVPRTVMLETEWVLRGVYDLPTREVIQALRAVAGLPGVVVEDPLLVARALDWAEGGMDFADALHVAAARDCVSFLTFDRRLARSASRAGGISVAVP